MAFSNPWILVRHPYAASLLVVMGLVALLLAALVSDFFFVEPVLTITRHSLILAAYYSVAALVSFKVRKKVDQAR